MHRGLQLLRRAGLVMFAVGGTALAVPAIASANPNCGSVVTHNITLSANMFCPDTAIFVGRDGITINLNGFTVQDQGNGVGIDNAGDWSASAPGSGGTAGPGSGFDNVTVENGQVQNFYYGVEYVSTTGGVVQNVTTQNNYEGIEYNNSSHGLIMGVTSRQNSDDGLQMYDNHAVTVTASKFNRNGGAGITDDHSRDTLNGVTASLNSQWGVFVREPLQGTSRRYLIENSKANSNGLSGFKIDDNSPTTLFQARVTGNVARNNGTLQTSDGWGFFADQTVVSDPSNHASGNFAGQCFKVQCTVP